MSPSPNAVKPRSRRLTTLLWAPPFAQGLVRDLRVRWALEEAGFPYEVRQVARDEQQSDAYLAEQPFGQVPVYEEDGLSLFESGAIVRHLAEQSEALMPADAAGRARTTTWMFAALNSVEPAINNLVELDFFNRMADWAAPRRPAVLSFLNKRLGAVSTWLKGRDYLEERFTAGDLLMTSVLRILRHTTIVAETPHLQAYVSRCEARPAFAKALDAQMKAFADNAPRT
jgi:glutathione S-transferase